MDNRNEVREFLVSRRARITPGQVGLPAYGSNRRVPGLRREEVAMLAGMSADYYTQPRTRQPDRCLHPVLDALARALHLDEAERAHLFNLAHTANTPTRGPGRRHRHPHGSGTGYSASSTP